MATVVRERQATNNINLVGVFENTKSPRAKLMMSAPHVCARGHKGLPLLGLEISPPRRWFAQRESHPQRITGFRLEKVDSWNQVPVAEGSADTIAEVLQTTRTQQAQAFRVARARVEGNVTLGNYSQCIQGLALFCECFIWSLYESSLKRNLPAMCRFSENVGLCRSIPFPLGILVL